MARKMAIVYKETVLTNSLQIKSTGPLEEYFLEAVILISIFCTRKKLGFKLLTLLRKHLQILIYIKCSESNIRIVGSDF
jgi:hypothetical protein